MMLSPTQLLPDSRLAACKGLFIIMSGGTEAARTPGYHLSAIHIAMVFLKGWTLPLARGAALSNQ
ncbi:hypothetical protein CFR71_14160 [Novacetimonas pomaceti]|uniref:Uncharacterized protein n=1 Tax=Novacetimonas pomaceti TaxID=2021998 RepID=A0A318Q4Y4_9PROT|nr:hypothetical protein CFR71_14160 [Novacetimonas pomaceti]